MSEVTIVKKSNKILLWIVLIVVVVAVALVSYFYGKQIGTKQKIAATPLEKTGASIERWDYGTVLPEVFPKNFPFESGTRLITSLKSQDKNSGDITVQLAYYSKKDIGTLINTFRNYFTSNNWVITTDTATGEIYSLYAKRSKEDMNILMRFDPTGLGLKVDITYLLRK